MSDEQKPDVPDPIEAARKGLGLLFQAARLTLERVPTQKVEEAVLHGAREVGRVFETVTDAIDEQLKKHDGRAHVAPPSPPEPPKADPTDDPSKVP
jgi:hypothetical protein